MHGVNRHEVDAQSLLWTPVAKGALIVLATAQSREHVFQLRAHFLPVQTEIRFAREQETGKRRAGDLLAAAVRKFLQVSIEAVGETERQRGDGSDEFAEFGIHVARHGRVYALLRKAARAHLRHEG